ncbi:MAG: hypothetical protein ACYDDF_12775 [Thermoplasmatota archaeon]
MSAVIGWYFGQQGIDRAERAADVAQKKVALFETMVPRTEAVATDVEWFIRLPEGAIIVDTELAGKLEEVRGSMNEGGE